MTSSLLLPPFSPPLASDLELTYWSLSRSSGHASTSSSSSSSSSRSSQSFDPRSNSRFWSFVEERGRRDRYVVGVSSFTASSCISLRFGTCPYHFPLLVQNRHACWLVEFPKEEGAARGVRVLFDPVFSNRCSPSQLMGPARYTRESEPSLLLNVSFRIGCVRPSKREEDEPRARLTRFFNCPSSSCSCSSRRPSSLRPSRPIA